MADPKDLIDKLSTYATARMAVYAEAAKDTADKLASGDYTGAEFADDVSKGWKRMAEDVSELLKILPPP